MSFREKNFEYLQRNDSLKCLGNPQFLGKIAERLDIQRNRALNNLLIFLPEVSREA